MQKPVYRAPEVLTHQPIRFETTQSCRPELGDDEDNDHNINQNYNSISPKNK